MTRYNGQSEAFLAAESDGRAVLKRLVTEYRADFLMTVMVLIWGFHFIVLKNGVDNIPPLTFSALRLTKPLSRSCTSSPALTRL